MKRILLVLLILTACSAPVLDTGDTVERLKGACNQACGSSLRIEISLRAGSTLYTTEDAVCIKRDIDGHTQLYCGTCACGTYGLLEGFELVAETESELACTFTDTGLVELNCV